MKYKILKHISGPTFRSCNEGDMVEVDYGSPILVSDGIKISLSELIEQGFIEEVKETPKPRWKVGDNVVKINSDRARFVKVSDVEEIYKGEFWYDGYGEYCFRDPTPEELSTYFR